VRWWVAPEHAGRGTFRWLILRNAPDGQVLWTSKSFALLARGEDLLVEVQLE
jgi:hypothetical protein